MNTNSQSKNALPSTKTLLKSTILAIVVAAIILITIVLPAEYGTDPSGIGKILGLKKMGEIKASLSQEAIADKIKNNKQSKNYSETKYNPSNYIVQKGEIEILLQPNKGRELKVTMLKDKQINYNWKTNGEAVYFAAHTDSGEPHDYSEGTKSNDRGVLKAFCDGRHGWWFKNRISKEITITLQVEGNYSDFREEF